jgi:hypothetical protein
VISGRNDSVGPTQWYDGTVTGRLMGLDPTPLWATFHLHFNENVFAGGIIVVEMTTRPGIAGAPDGRSDLPFNRIIRGLACIYIWFKSRALRHSLSDCSG